MYYLDIEIASCLAMTASICNDPDVSGAGGYELSALALGIIFVDVGFDFRKAIEVLR